MGQPDLLRVAVSLLFIVGLLLVLAWVARRSGWMRSAPGRGSLKISALQRLGARASVVIIEVEDARLVLGITSQQITLLHTLPRNADPATEGPPSQAFAGKLGQMLSRPR